MENKKMKAHKKNKVIGQMRLLEANINTIYEYMRKYNRAKNEQDEYEIDKKIIDMMNKMKNDLDSTVWDVI